jgi:lysozyme family protein
VSLDTIIDGILEAEGGFVNDPRDRGNATNFGITLATLSVARGRAATVEDVKDLTADEARTIYRDRYILRPGFGNLPEPLRTEVVDHGVLSGTATATRDLQLAVGVVVDGVLGPVTRAAVEAADIQALTLRLIRERTLRLAQIVIANPSQIAFLRGWLRRALRYLEG